ncbi:MAG: sodium-dependent bicarbonate transport family permease [Candidatus Nanopelagicaceae bacterium]
MTGSFQVAIDNLTSVAVLVFAFGFLAARIKSDVRIPEPIYQAISIYLLFGIGLKGGNAIRTATFDEFIAPALGTIFIGILIPLVAFFTLRAIKRLSAIDRGAIAAHYGSTSLVTFSAGLLFLENNLIEVEGFATALLTLLEIPGLIVGIYLGTRSSNAKVKWRETITEVLLGKTVLLLAGGLLIGAITSNAGYRAVSPFFVDLLNGILVLFLLHLGFVAGSNWFEIKRVGFPLILFALLFPVFAGTIGVVVGTITGLSVGGAAILGILAASASYIAAPAAISVAMPQANGSLALMASIGVTFPFNLILGIPIYLRIAQLI